MSEDQVNIHAAKTHLSRLVDRVEAGEEVVIARAGRPVARLVPLGARERKPVSGGWQGRVRVASDFDGPNAEIQAAFAVPRPRATLDHRLPSIVGRIVRAVDPVKVVLFGSRARGDERPDSDYDLLVIVDEAPDRRGMEIEIRRSFRDVLVPADVVVATEAEAEGRVPGRPAGVVYWALKEGFVVYERGNGS